MKVILTILSIFISTTIAAQCQPGIDTVRAKLDVKVGTNIWDYFERDGTPLWKGVKGYDSMLIPNNGYAIQRMKIQAYDGYIVYHTSPDCVAVVADILDSKRKRIKGILVFDRPYN